MKIRQAVIDDYGQIVTLINSTAQNLIEKDIYQWAYPCELNEIEQEINNNEVFLLEENNKIVGSYSIKPLAKEFPVPVKNGLYLYRMIIHPFFQGKNIGGEIFDHLRDKYKKKDKILFDCWAGNDKLKDFYLKNGCMFIGDYPDETYKISVFSVY